MPPPPSSLRRAILAALGLAAALAGAPRAFAGEGPSPGSGAQPVRERLPEPPAPADPREEDLKTAGRAYVTGTWWAPSDLEADRGTVQILRGSLDVEGKVRVRDDLSVVYGFGFERSEYDFGDPDAVVSGTGRLLEEGTSVRIAPGLLWRSARGLGLGGTLNLKASGAPGAAFEDSLTWGVTASVRVPTGGGKHLTVGGIYSTNLDGTSSLYPFLGFGGGSVGALRVNTRGAGVVVSKDLNDRWAVGLGVRYEGREFRLAKDDRIPDGIASDTRFPIGIDLDWRPSKPWQVTLSAGASVYTEFRFQDKDGHDVRYVEADPSPYLSLLVTFNF